MKKIILTGAMAAFFFAAYAQDDTNNQTIDRSRQTATVADPDAQSRQFNTDLQLSEGQFIYFRNINRQRAERLQQINQQYANDPQMRQMKVDELDSEIDNQLAEILNEEQLNTYLELQGRGVAADLEGGEMKVKTDELKMKSDDEKTKIETPEMKMKAEENKMKVETPDYEMKVKGDEEKFKSDDVKYKSEPGKSKLQTPDSKVKVDGDKTKIETNDGELKVTEDKAKMKTNNEKVKVKKRNR